MACCHLCQTLACAVKILSVLFSPPDCRQLFLVSCVLYHGLLMTAFCVAEPDPVSYLLASVSHQGQAIKWFSLRACFGARRTSGIECHSGCLLELCRAPLIALHSLVVMSELTA